MKRVLVTGGTGLIGRHTLPALVELGYEVHATYSSRPGEPGADLSWHRANLLDLEETTRLVGAVRPTHLIHLAWYTAPGKVWTSSENIRWVEASLRLLEAFSAVEGKRFVGAGTCYEYDLSHGVCREAETPLAPATLYGTCKHALHLMAAALGEQEGFSVGWGRVFLVYGPGEHPTRLVASVVRSLLRGDQAPCSDGSQVRDFLYSEDVASALVHLLDSGVQGPVNIASGERISVRELASLVGSSMGSPELLRFGELPRLPGDPPLLAADIRRLRDEVGWKPSVSLGEGVDRTIDWWRARYEGEASVRDQTQEPV